MIRGILEGGGINLQNWSSFSNTSVTVINHIIHKHYSVSDRNEMWLHNKIVIISSFHLLPVKNVEWHRGLRNQFSIVNNYLNINKKLLIARTLIAAGKIRRHRRRRNGRTRAPYKSFHVSGWWLRAVGRAHGRFRVRAVVTNGRSTNVIWSP